MIANDEGPQHRVRITKPYGMTEVTRGMWFAVVNTKPWDGQPYIQEGSGFPMSFGPMPSTIAGN